MTYSIELANVHGGEQMELATVVEHRECFKPNDGSIRISSPFDAGIRLAKLLRQYDESPSSALWSEIQSVARDVLR